MRRTRNRSDYLEQKTVQDMTPQELAQLRLHLPTYRRELDRLYPKQVLSVSESQYVIGLSQYLMLQMEKLMPADLPGMGEDH